MAEVIVLTVLEQVAVVVVLVGLEVHWGQVATEAQHHQRIEVQAAAVVQGIKVTAAQAAPVS